MLTLSNFRLIGATALAVMMLMLAGSLGGATVSARSRESRRYERNDNKKNDRRWRNQKQTRSFFKRSSSRRFRHNDDHKQNRHQKQWKKGRNNKHDRRHDRD
jgi:hypothetical protein